ncbi:butyrate kinase [Coprothermobacter platensis]|uniref:butyrate kinase n=1 Tax=Coprothermobacter platensis TaxID=108819 RepID=UPI00047815E8|nr:butyrate kinase [Coprothermobacter platensis]
MNHLEKYVLVINPGSTSTKLALFLFQESGVAEKVEKTVEVPLQIIEEKPHYLDQISFRLSQVRSFLKENGVSENQLVCIASRGGPIKPLPAGTYKVTKHVCDDIMSGRVLTTHSSLIGPVVAYNLSQEWGIPAYFTDPVSVDEFIPEAKVSGLPEIPRYSALHALNMRAVARKYADSVGKTMDDLTAVIAHLGGGFSIGAMEKGRLIDSTNPNEDGPFQLERAGSLPISDFVDYIYDNWPDLKALNRRISGKGGLVAYFGTNSFKDILSLSKEDKNKALVLQAMYYQVGKYIVAMNAVLKGSAEVIILTGGIMHNPEAIDGIKRYTSWMKKPYAVYPGGYEMEALALGAWRVMKNVEPLKDYEVSDYGN